MLRETYNGEVALSWEGDPPADRVIELVIADIRGSLADLAKPEDLIFHTVFLDDDNFHGPAVLVWGAPGSDRFHCEYQA